jgi:hypothetical protein
VTGGASPATDKSGARLPNAVMPLAVRKIDAMLAV